MRGSKLKYLIGRKWKLLSVWSNSPSLTVLNFKTVDEPVYILVQLFETGRVEMVRMGQVMSMKPDRRRRVANVAHKALAYHALMGSVEGFPEQELL